MHITLQLTSKVAQMNLIKLILHTISIFLNLSGDLTCKSHYFAKFKVAIFGVADRRMVNPNMFLLKYLYLFFTVPQPGPVDGITVKEAVKIKACSSNKAISTAFIL